MRKNQRHKSVWFQRGKVLVRRNDGERKIIIVKTQDYFQSWKTAKVVVMKFSLISRSVVAGKSKILVSKCDNILRTNVRNLRKYWDRLEVKLHTSN